MYASFEAQQNVLYPLPLGMMPPLPRGRVFRARSMGGFGGISICELRNAVDENAGGEGRGDSRSYLSLAVNIALKRGIFCHLQNTTALAQVRYVYFLECFRRLYIHLKAQPPPPNTRCVPSTKRAYSNVASPSSCGTPNTPDKVPTRLRLRPPWHVRCYE